NAVTDFRIVTPCNPITNTRGGDTGGCGFSLDQSNWSSVAQVNRGGDPVTVTVRATANGSCVAASASRRMLFAQEDLIGGVYYWQSAVVNNQPGRAGGIFRYDFGRPDLPPAAFLESGTANNNRCIG